MENDNGKPYQAELDATQQAEWKPKPKPGAPWKITMEKFVDNWTVALLMNIITIYSLFFDDIRIITFPKSSDDFFYGVTLVAMICFTLEIVLASISKEDYFLTFFFWLDLVSTLSMIPDCGWIWDPITGGGGSNAAAATDLAKTSRAGRITRVIRVIRLIRLIRIVKLYK